MRLAAIGDIHCRINSRDLIRDLFREVEQKADALVLAGDLTDTGQPAEMEVLLEELHRLPVPVVAVLGNHDHESGYSDELCKMMISAGVHLLQGTAVELGDVGFVGTKGFCGGFNKTLVQPFGEQALKTFINSSIEEAITLENAVARLDCTYKVAVLHYAPISETLEGEPPELFPFLGTSRLANALDRQGVNVIFHGHAHHGSPEGKTAGGIPVHNVSRFVQSRYSQNAFCLFET